MPVILGIDPGSRITGFGVIQSDGLRHRYIASGAIKTSAGSMASRCHQIYQGIAEVVANYVPEEVGVEQVFMDSNANSALKLGQARGAALVAVAAQNLVVAEYSPRKIKQCVVGYGAAEKDQIQHMIKLLLNLSGTPQVDAADALAVAVCHAHSRGVSDYKEAKQ